MRFAALVASGLLLVSSSAGAHPAPFSYLDVHLADGGLEGTLTLHVLDLAHDLGIKNPPDLLDPAGAERARGRVIALVSDRLWIGTGGDRIVPEWQRIEPAPERDAVRLRFRAAASLRGSVTVRARLFPYDSMHQTFVNVYEGETLRQQTILTAARDRQTYYRASAQGAAAVAGTFVPAGIHHILIGPDHILFLVGLLLLGGDWWRLVTIVTAFTLGHSLTLSLAALEIVAPPATLIEPAIALSIIFVGADNLLVGTSGRDVRAWIALLFGLIHGFGFAYVLREFGLPREALAWSLFSFNLGVEIGQLVVVLIVAGALAWVRQHNAAAARRLAYAGSVIVMAAGGYWFVQRVFFAGGA